MKFRRSFSKIEHGNIRRRAIVITFAVVILVFLLQSFIADWYKPPAPNAINIAFLSDSTYLVETDTTNYAQFASTLRKTVKEAKQDYAKNYIQITLPKDKKVGSIADIIQVANAMNLKVALDTEQ